MASQERDTFRCSLQTTSGCLKCGAPGPRGSKRSLLRLCTGCYAVFSALSELHEADYVGCALDPGFVAGVCAADGSNLARLAADALLTALGACAVPRAPVPGVATTAEAVAARLFSLQGHKRRARVLMCIGAGLPSAAGLCFGRAPVGSADTAFYGPLLERARLLHLTPPYAALAALVLEVDAFVITSNVDAALSRLGVLTGRLLEIHGNVARSQCSRVCQRSQLLDTDQAASLPRCNSCGARRRLCVSMAGLTDAQVDWRAYNAQLDDFRCFIAEGDVHLILAVGVGEHADSLAPDIHALWQRLGQPGVVAFNAVAPKLTMEHALVRGDLRETFPALVDAMK